MLGAQAQLWGEYIKDAAHREYMAYPRACAMAEVLWSAEKEPFDAFLLRLNAHLERLRVAEVNFRPLDEPRPRRTVGVGEAAAGSEGREPHPAQAGGRRM